MSFTLNLYPDYQQYLPKYKQTKYKEKSNKEKSYQVSLGATECTVQFTRLLQLVN